MDEYKTVEQAQAALEAAFQDVEADNPDIIRDEVASDIITSVAQFIDDLTVRDDFYRRELGWNPEDDRATESW